MTCYNRIRRWLLITTLLGLGLFVLIGCNHRACFGIVFASNRAGNFEIYRMTSEGHSVERLTYTPDYDEQVVKVSPDGSKILFDRGGMRLEREVYLLDADSGIVSQLTDALAYDIPGTWSPDGKRIAFISDRDGGCYHLYLMNSDGSEQHHVPLVTDSERDVISVTWSPDSRYIVYGTREHIHAHVVLTSTLFIVDLSTSNVTRLTDEELGNCGGPTWSPDNEWIAMDCTKGISSDYKIYIVRPDGSELSQVTIIGSELGACWSPDWSPDGTWIATVCKGVSAGDYGEIYIIHPDGSDFKQVTTKPADYKPDIPADSFLTWVRELHWSPDGRQIVYTATVDGTENIYIIDTDGKNNRRLTNHRAVDRWLSVYRLP